MSEQTILKQRRDEGQALVDIADQGLHTAEDHKAFEELKAQHQAGFEAVKDQVKLLTAGEVKASDADRNYRIDSYDHNAR